MWGHDPTDEVVEVSATRSRADAGLWGIGETVTDSPWSYRLERCGPSRPWRITATAGG